MYRKCVWNGKQWFEVIEGSSSCRSFSKYYHRNSQSEIKCDSSFIWFRKFLSERQNFTFAFCIAHFGSIIFKLSTFNCVIWALLFYNLCDLSTSVFFLICHRRAYQIDSSVCWWCLIFVAIVSNLILELVERKYIYLEIWRP